ncbi:glycosyltransferase family 2 protein [Paenibacillus assamensis]|uniref:glycosyltransferase family 2 protein n=1 Tax=Paenibacillus assamensis TaxID=311244 RepID=UPI0003FFC08D|nr:glycosyltransferase family 2 protein [Paenibacillus assamensis]
MKVLVIIPAYNEEATIHHVIDELRNYMPEVDVVVINDGSTDRTAEIAERAGAKVFTVPYNVGIGGGMQIGYMYAHRMNYDYAVQMDADGQHCASDLPKLIEHAKHHDLVIGSRYVEETSYQSSKMRRIGMIFFSNIITWITKQRITDTTSGYRVANRRVIALYSSYYPTDYPEVESIVYLKRKGCRISEVSTEMRARLGGNSSITPLRSVYYMTKVTLAVLMTALRYER